MIGRPKQNGGMKSARVLILLLMAATVLVNLSVLARFGLGMRPRDNWPSLLVLTIYALATSQASLAAIWLALGRSWLSLRLLAAVLVAVAWSVLMDFPMETAIPMLRAAWFTLLATQMALAGIPLALARACGLSVAQERTRFAPVDAHAALRPAQFSLLYLLSWITSVAVMLGTVQWVCLGLSFRAWHDLEDFDLVLVIAAGNALLALAVLWGALGARWLIVRVLLPPVLAVAVVFAIAAIALHEVDLPPFVVFYFLEMLLLASSLAVVRIAGYRLVWREKREAGQAAG